MDEVLHWDLDNIVSVDDFDRLFAEVEADLRLYDEFLLEMDPDMSTEKFREYLLFDDGIERKIDRLQAMPMMMIHKDEDSDLGKKLRDRSKDLGESYADKTRKIGHWIKGKDVEGKRKLDDKNAERLFKAIPILEERLTHVREGVKYTLGEKEEKVVTAKDLTGVSVLVELRGTIQTGLEFKLEVEGEEPKEVKMLSDLTKLYTSPRPEVRKAAYKAIFTGFGKRIKEFFTIFKARLKDYAKMAEMRGFKSPVDSRNRQDRIPGKAVDALLKVCQANTGMYQRYFAWKARQLGVGKLRRFDIYAPLDSTERKISFGDAVDLVFDTFDQAIPGFAVRARKIFDEKHVDSHPTPTKRGGAYCMTVEPGITPYVLLNFNGQASYVPTIAHELGHAIHGLYANQNMHATQHSGIPLAETASTFAEFLLFDRLLEEAESDQEKATLLSARLSNSYATVMRQAYFAIFESRAHDAIREGTSVGELSDVYFDTLTEQFGDSLVIDPAFRFEWAYIPHFVSSPFYVRGYSFGESLSTALYTRFKEEGEAFIPVIERILSAGGSINPAQLLMKEGIDITSEEFWQGSFDTVQKWQDQLEKYSIAAK